VYKKDGGRLFKDVGADAKDAVRRLGAEQFEAEVDALDEREVDAEEARAEAIARGESEPDDMPEIDSDDDIDLEIDEDDVRSLPWLGAALERPA
jgi:hypothetical protein